MLFFIVKSKKSSPPGPFPKARENTLDDDIEKRVLVNKDGSLSMEMKVRFRLLNDEMLHCSTEIKKSSCTFNVSFPGQDNGNYPHCGHSESCSEAESLSASEAEDVYITRRYQKHLEEPHCQHCCTHCQEYDLWKNPALSEQETLRHIGSTSLNVASKKIKRRKESVDSVHTTSCEEYTEQVVENATCIRQTVGEGDKGDNTVQYCTISRCCSRSETCSVSKKANYTDEKYGKNESTHTLTKEEKRPSKDQKSVQITQVSIEDERPLSVETNSSDILASLKEDEDKDETDLSPSNSRASRSNKESDEQTRNATGSPYSFTPCKPPESPKQSLSTRTSSTASSRSVKSKTSRKVELTDTQGNVDQDGNNTPASTPQRCHHKELEDVAIENGTSKVKLEAISQSEEALDENDVVDNETVMRALRSVSDLSKTCDDISDDTVETFQTNEKGRSSAMSMPPNPHAGLTIPSTYVVAGQECVNVKEPMVPYVSEEENIIVASHAMSTDSDTTEPQIAKNKTEEPADVTYEEKVASAKSTKSNARSNWRRLSEVAFKEGKKTELQKRERSPSVMSVHSNASTISKQSTVSELLVNETEDKTEEVMPCALSKASRSSQISDLETSELREMEDQIEDRSPSIMSVKSSISEDTPVKLVQSSKSLTSALSTETNISDQSITSKISGTPIDMDIRLLMERVPSAMSAKSDTSRRSKTSNILDISPNDDDPVEKLISNTSTTSSRSNTPNISTVAHIKACDVEKKSLKRPSSNISSKSASSVKSTKSKLRDKKDEKTEQDSYITGGIPSKTSDSDLSKKSNTSEATMDKSGDFEDHSEEKAPGTMSAKSNVPTKSNKSETVKLVLETDMEQNDERLQSSTSSVSCASKKCQLSETAQECDHPQERSASIMSNTSVKSKKSGVSDATCENEKEETKPTGRRSQNALSVSSQRSKKSKASEASRQDTGYEDNRERAPSGMSCKSIPSDRANLAHERVDKTGSTEYLLKEPEGAYEETTDDRAASALSSKSQMSSLSNKSKGRTQERAPTAKHEGEEKYERASILVSSSSTKSTRSTKSESLAVSPAEVKNQSTERTLSAMSGKSNTSKKSKKNSVLDCLKEPKKANEEELVERSPSAVSAKSNTSVRSRGSDTQSNRPLEKIHLSTISPTSSTSAKDEKSNFSIISNNCSNVVEVKSEETYIKIEERAPSGMSNKSSLTSRSVKSNISALVGGQTDTVNLTERSDSSLSGLKIFMTENSSNAVNEERASSALSKKSNNNSAHHTSERALTPASASVSIGFVEEYDVDNAEDDNSVSLVSVNSTPRLNLKTDVCYKDSSKISENESQQGLQKNDDRAKSSLTTGTIASDISKKSKCTCKNSSQPITDNEMANNKSAKKKSSSHRLNSRSANSDCGPSKTKDRNPPAVTGNVSNTLSHLEVNGQNSNANAKSKRVDEQSKSNHSNGRYKEDKEEISRSRSADALITSVSTDNGVLKQKSKEPVVSLGVYNHRSSRLNKNGNKLNTSRNLDVCGGTCNGSLVATDCSRNVNDNKSEKNSNSNCRYSSSSLAQKEDNDPSELVPSILPTSSPTEVVNEWLKKIPLDSALCDIGDEFHEYCEEEEPLKMSGKVTPYERGNGSEGDTDAAVWPQNEQLGAEEIENNENKVGDVSETSKDFAVVENIPACSFPDVPSSVQLMRILLSPKLDRCNSLPEVSPVYGRKLSTSARGFLDSLVSLQLLDFDPNDVNGKAEKYSDLMNTLQSLWLCDPSDRVTNSQKSKYNNKQSNDNEFIVKSSLGVAINNSSQDSGKSSVNESTVVHKSQTNTEGEAIEILTKVQEIDETEKWIETKSDSVTPDIASRVRWTPENEADLTMRNDYSPKDPPDTASISNRSSGNHSNEDQKLTNHEEDASSEPPSSRQMAQLPEKVCQDPDPAWVLNLLNKIEKQFMTHYISAMAEFKVRWNLNDNKQLDVMICELKDEVHRRIQASINNELRKIQGHGGRPRPPKEPMSRESSIFTGQRRKRLRGNLNQSIDPAAKTDDDNSAILMTDFSEDEYCPCDTCMKKKILPRPVLAVEVSNPAPVTVDFDLKKILHLKRHAPSNSKENVKENEEQQMEVGNLPENFKKEKSQELCKSNSELQDKSTESIKSSSLEQNESDTSNDKGFGKKYSQAVEGSKPQEVRKGSSSTSLEGDASDIQPNDSELKNDQPMKEESSKASDELQDHVELRKRTEIMETANAETTAEEKNAQSGLADMGTEAKVTEDEEEICDELSEGKESVEGETVREDHAMVAGTAKENMATEAGTEQEVAEGESQGKGSGTETSDNEIEDKDNLLDKKESLGERTGEDNESVEGELSESESEEGGEIPDDEKETHGGAKTRTTWKNMPVKSALVEMEATIGEVAEKKVATTATEESKIKSEIIEDRKEAEDKSDVIEDATDDEDDAAETEEKSMSAEEHEAIIRKETREANLIDEEKISEPAEDGDITEHESAEEANPMNDESTKEGKTDNDEIDAEGKTTKAETAADEEPADNETTEYKGNVYDDTSDGSDIIEVKTVEDGETDGTTKDGETIGEEEADIEETDEAKASEGDDNESDDSETIKAQTTEHTSDDERAENGETPNAEVAEDGEICDDGTTDDEGVDDAETGDAEIAENRESDDEEISEIEETVDIGITTKIKTTEYEETHDEPTEVVVADEEEANEASEKNRVDDDDDDDERAEESERARTEVAEVIVDSEIAEDREENVQKTEGEARDNEKMADGRANDETAEDTEMDTSQGIEYGETADDEADNEEIDYGGTREDGETPNGNKANDETAEDEKLSVSDEKTEPETAEDGEQEDNGKADGQLGDDEVTDDEATAGTENEESEETAEAETGEDDNGTTEDGDTADEKTTGNEELSENEIAQNGEIVNGTIEECGQTDDSESLENGETAGEVNGGTHEGNTAEAVTNTYKSKAKQNSEMCITQETFESNRCNIRTPSVNTGESDEGGDEAEDETEPSVESNGRALGIAFPATQPIVYSLHKADKRTIASLDSTTKVDTDSEDGADADGEDSETEVHKKHGSVENEEDG